ncbi:RNAP subunit Rpb5 [Cannes 8 virus]|uniref:RNAP subunit Rpb5 n=1 Tax=Marseillevirus marseillevirus TaxID=694581 RepID=D2XB19_GBMV|nr:RNAP subunit Rpb5 [Marseillevirus marseillevirus]YP_009094843.1 conserved DNA-directed RNA polymerase subunit RPB5 [Melbournevirus]ADB04146.1 RNAP subunit Rpb5 [Marseillevirus marseillevirus]AGV01751.1 RNAP subunit Rpb5 [Cannes 8 virus]AIT54955.1 DNA-directed RNA polymerase subunit RPB5 [Melbournevirus]
MDFQLSRAKKTVVRMMSDRGYLPLKRLPDPKGSSSREPICWEFENEQQKKANVFWNLDRSESKMPFIQYVFEVAVMDKLEQVVIVVDKGLVSKGKNTVSSMSENVDMTVFEVSDLQVITPDHVDVPPHKKLSEKKKRETLEKYGVELDKCPKILKDDPVVKWYGWSCGDLIKILQPGEGNFGPSVNYRVVCLD